MNDNEILDMFKDTFLDSIWRDNIWWLSTGHVKDNYLQDGEEGIEVPGDVLTFSLVPHSDYRIKMMAPLFNPKEYGFNISHVVGPLRNKKPNPYFVTEVAKACAVEFNRVFSTTARETFKKANVNNAHVIDLSDCIYGSDRHIQRLDIALASMERMADALEWPRPERCIIGNNSYCRLLEKVIVPSSFAWQVNNDEFMDLHDYDLFFGVKGLGMVHSLTVMPLSLLNINSTNVVQGEIRYGIFGNKPSKLRLMRTELKVV